MQALLGRDFLFFKNCWRAFSKHTTINSATSSLAKNTGKTLGNCTGLERIDAVALDIQAVFVSCDPEEVPGKIGKFGRIASPRFDFENAQSSTNCYEA